MRPKPTHSSEFLGVQLQQHTAPPVARFSAQPRRLRWPFYNRILPDNILSGSRRVGPGFEGHTQAALFVSSMFSRALTTGRVTSMTFDASLKDERFRENIADFMNFTPSTERSFRL